MLNFIYNDLLIAGLVTAIPKHQINIKSYTEKYGDQKVKECLAKHGFIASRISIPEQTASDLGFEAARKIFATKNIDTEEIGFVVTVTRTPDYRSPATSAVLHYRLGLNKDCICYDINIGGAGFIYGLNAGLAMLDNINKKYGLLIIGDTTSKLIDNQDPIAMRFSDGAAALLLQKFPRNGNKINISTAADGHFFQTILNPGGAFRNYNPIDNNTMIYEDQPPGQDKLSIDETRFQKFATSIIPDTLIKYLEARKNNISNYDLLAIHPETKDIIEDISHKLDFDAEMLINNIVKYGNTLGNTIPLILADVHGNRSNENIKVLACGYGEGLSWGFADFTINSSDILPIIETDDHFSEAAVSHDF